MLLFELEDGTYGFQSSIATDPIMYLVRTEEGKFPYAEERRVFM